jgi:hypothetical protein
MRIELDSEVFADFERAQHLEWLETNGKGGFASSTVLGANTRRYHGLLTAALTPPARRHLLLSRLEEVIEPRARPSTRVQLLSRCGPPDGLPAPQLLSPRSVSGVDLLGR